MLFVVRYEHFLFECTSGTGKSLEKDSAVAEDKEEEGSLP